MDSWSGSRLFDRFVVRDPVVRGGEPTIRGTRIPVRMLAELAAQGASRGELLEDHPALTAESLDHALRWAQLNPPGADEVPLPPPWHGSSG